MKVRYSKNLLIWKWPIFITNKESSEARGLTTLSIAPSPSRLKPQPTFSLKDFTVNSIIPKNKGVYYRKTPGSNVENYINVYETSGFISVNAHVTKGHSLNFRFGSVFASLVFLAVALETHAKGRAVGIERTNTHGMNCHVGIAGENVKNFVKEVVQKTC
jgi:hypothetical protein